MNLPPQIADPLSETRYHHVLLPKRRRRWRCGCCLLPVLFGCLAAVLSLAFLLPGRTNILLLGIDARPKEGAVGRSDTMILTTIVPSKPYIGALSIPRDLWVDIPGYGQNRINTAHFFAEAAQPGSGPLGAMQAVRQDFGITVDYYLRIRFGGFKDIVDAMGGVDVTLPQAMSGYPAGKVHLNGTQALALVRDRETSDDFFRMQRGQIFLKAAFKELLSPLEWPHLPVIALSLARSVETDIPLWQWPRLGLVLLRLGPGGIDTRIIDRDMVRPFTTSSGAEVLAPEWSKINPLLMEMFGQ